MSRRGSLKGRQMDFHVYRQGGNQWLVFTGLLLTVGLWSLAAVMIGHQSSSITPLHYTIYFGIDLTGAANRLVWFPLLGTISLLSHLFIGRLPYGSAWTKSWLVINIFLQLMLLAGLVTVFIVDRIGH